MAAVRILEVDGTIVSFTVEFWWCVNRFQIPSSCKFIAENVSLLGSEALLLGISRSFEVSHGVLVFRSSTTVFLNC